MNELKSLKNESLLVKTKLLVGEECRISVEVLKHLQEIEIRKAYFQLNFISLFDYAVSELKYSEAAAMRRIQAMRALSAHPELESKLEEGLLTVSGVARVQSFIRKEEKLKDEKWETEDKLNLYESVGNHSQREIEKTLVQISPQAALIESVKEVSEQLSEVKIYLSADEMKELELLRGLLAHQLKNPGSNSELIQKMIGISKAAVMKKKGESVKTGESECRTVSPMAESSVVNPVPITRVENESRYLPEKIKKYLFSRASFCCEHIDVVTGKSCRSAFKLEIDHVHPYAMGGSNELKNLRVLCRAHNVMRNHG